MRQSNHQGTTRAMNLAMNREVEALESRVPFLATVASVSPYIGLFGTVWGIMQCIYGIKWCETSNITKWLRQVSQKP